MKRLNRRNLKFQATLLAGILTFSSEWAQSSVVAVIDSGLDYKHEGFGNQVWTNSLDSTFNGIDDDNNGFTDDVHGLNFIERNGKIIDYKYGRLYNQDVKDFFTFQAKAIEGLATEAELKFMEERLKSSVFLKRLTTYANYAHGTHVAGISAALGAENQVLGIKLIPTESPFAELETQIKSSLAQGKELNWILKNIIKIGLSLLAETQGALFGEIGKAVNSYQADVANASLGIGPTQARAILTPLLTLAQRGEAPSEDLLNEMVSHLLKEMNRTQKKLVTEAPNTLFVFAAGNDGENNDLFPTAPASIDHPHVISVAAATPKGALALFSNYGKAVDIAAPGVGIDSLVPDNRRLALSGTSQAAPYIAGLAAEIKNHNKALKPAALKKIILETADRLSAEGGRYTAYGHVNRDRALLAADYSLSRSLAQAITQSFADLPRAQLEGEKALDILTEAPQGQVIGPITMPQFIVKGR